jgi:hypothetical protein
LYHREKISSLWPPFIPRPLATWPARLFFYLFLAAVKVFIFFMLKDLKEIMVFISFRVFWDVLPLSQIDVGYTAVYSRRF